MGFLAYFNEDKDPHEAARDDPASIGNILLEWGFVTSEELEAAMIIQKSQRLLGQILVDVTEGRLTEGQLREALMEQKIRRNKASHREIMAFNRDKKKRLASGISDSFDSIVAKLEGSGG